MGVHVQQVTGRVGAEVTGVDLQAGLDDDQLRAVQHALWDHGVLFFPDQHRLDDAAQIRFTEQLGPLERTTRDDEIFPIHTDADHPPYADEWHEDMTYEPRPPAIGVLRAVTLPPHGGDTVWASLYAAYEALSPSLRAWVDTLEVEHGVTPGFLHSLRLAQGPEAVERERHRPSVRHPLVRTHPDSGRRALFVSPRYMVGIVGLSAAESDMLIGHLARVLDDPNLQVRWRWRLGDVVVWDQRATAHRALADHFPATRTLMRTTVAGDVPVPCR